jgi:hypothetical protein
MSEIFITTLPLSLAAAVSVTSILVFFSIMVAKEKQLENGLAFMLGGIIAYTAVLLVVLFSFDKAVPAGAPKHQEIHAIADFILAGLCALLVVKSFFKKDKKDKEKESKVPGGAFAYLGIGALMRAASANTLPPFVAAVKDVSAAHLAVGSSVILCVLIILITMSPMIIPWLLFVFNKEKAIALITPVSRFLENNKAKISNTVLIVIAVYLAMHGFKHLGIIM